MFKTSFGYLKFEIEILFNNKNNSSQSKFLIYLVKCNFILSFNSCSFSIPSIISMSFILKSFKLFLEIISKI
jgi:hypothetical protein